MAETSSSRWQDTAEEQKMGLTWGTWSRGSRLRESLRNAGHQGEDGHSSDMKLHGLYCLWLCLRFCVSVLMKRSRVVGKVRILDVKVSIFRSRWERVRTLLIRTQEGIFTLHKCVLSWLNPADITYSLSNNINCQGEFYFLEQVEGKDPRRKRSAYYHVSQQDSLLSPCFECTVLASVL